MNVLLFGATGMVGQGVLRECLLDPEVELVNDDGPRKLEIFAERPHFLCLHFDAGHAIHQNQRRVGRHQ